MAKHSLLGQYVVLDLTDEKGFLCGKLMGDLGADVIKIEPPGGDPARQIGPFYKDIPHPEKSLHWLAYNTNKRSITLDIERKQGQEIFKRLVQDADFVIESFAPGYMDSLQLGYSALSDINKRIVVVSITPFGQTGPYKDFKASDIGCTAASGFMYLTGDNDRAPVRISFPQSYQHASLHALVGALIAHYHRLNTGEGQHVDVSIQESISTAVYDAPAYWFLNHKMMKREGSRRSRASGVLRRNIWRCKDGHVSLLILGGTQGAKFNKALAEWVESEGLATPSLSEMDWTRFDWAKVTQEEVDQLEEPIGRLLLKYSEAELYEEALNRDLLLYPVRTIESVIEDPQLGARSYWTEVEHPELGDRLIHPGSFAQISGVQYQLRPTPSIGQHNVEIYTKLGFSRDEIVYLIESGVM
ncbi:CaiB/BaiF CoA transferase family protein [Chloroflexota bacterium]